MKIAGSYEFNAAPGAVWEVLTDPRHLEKCIPGCQELREQGQGEYVALLTASVGPIRGQYNAKISMRDVAANHSYRLAVEGLRLLGLRQRPGVDYPEGAGGQDRGGGGRRLPGGRGRGPRGTADDGQRGQDDDGPLFWLPPGVGYVDGPG